MFHFFELKAAWVNLVHQSNWLLVRRTWATWSALNFFHVGQDSSGMLTYDESILAAFGSQRIVHQSEGIAQGPDGSPLSRDTPGFSWRRALLRIPDSRIHFAKKIIIIIIFIIQLFFFQMFVRTLNSIIAGQDDSPDGRITKDVFCRPGGAIRPPVANSCLCMPLASDTRMLSPQKITYNLFDG